MTDRRPIPTNPGYFASADGVIWTNRNPGQIRVNSGRKIDPLVDGFRRVGVIFKYSQPYVNVYAPRFNQVAVAALVLEAFDSPRSGRWWEYKDGNALNTAAANLRWTKERLNWEAKPKAPPAEPDRSDFEPWQYDEANVLRFTRKPTDEAMAEPDEVLNEAIARLRYHLGRDTINKSARRWVVAALRARTIEKKSRQAFGRLRQEILSGAQGRAATRLPRGRRLLPACRTAGSFLPEHDRARSVLSEGLFLARSGQSHMSVEDHEE